VEDKVKFYEGNLFDVDFSEATVLTLYLLPDVNLKLKPKILSEMKPGSRVVSHAFNMGDWKPDGQISVDGRSVFLWIIPEKRTIACLRYYTCIYVPLHFLIVEV